MYSGWDQIVHCVFVTILWVEEKQMYILCKPKTLLTMNRDRKVNAALKSLAVTCHATTEVE
jgi:hypothetical protein